MFRTRLLRGAFRVPMDSKRGNRMFYKGDCDAVVVTTVFIVVGALGIQVAAPAPLASTPAKVGARGGCGRGKELYPRLILLSVCGAGRYLLDPYKEVQYVVPNLSSCTVSPPEAARRTAVAVGPGCTAAGSDGS